MNDCLKPVAQSEFTTGEDGKKHFVYGKLHVNVTEHFAENGKTFSELLDEIVLARMREAERSAT